MFGQFLVEPEPEPDPEELEPDEFDELEPELDVPELDEDPDPELPVLLELDGVLVDEPDVVLVSALDVGVVLSDVVAALATSAPPATRPAVRAPAAITFRKRSCIGCVPFGSCGAAHPSGRALTTVRGEPWGRRRTTWVGRASCLAI
jgi:hypothetical protein